MAVFWKTRLHGPESRWKYFQLSRVRLSSSGLRCKSVAGARVVNKCDYYTKLYTNDEQEVVEDRIDQGVKVHDIARVLQFVLVLDDLRNKILQGLEEKRWHPLLLNSDGKVLFEHFFQIISAWLSNNIYWREILRMEKNFNGFFLCRQ